MKKAVANSLTFLFTAVTTSSTTTTTPSTPLLESDGPVLVKEPVDTYTTKNREAELSCRVVNTLSVHFDCNGESLRPTREQTIVEPETGVRYVEAHLTVSRDKMEEFIGDYHCACVAVGRVKSVRSRMAHVTFACKLKWPLPMRTSVRI